MRCPKCNRRISEEARFCPECGAAIVAPPEPAMQAGQVGADREPAAQIEVNQQVETVEGGRVVGVDLGEVLGDVTIGNYTLRIGTLNGGVVNVAPAHERRVTLPRPTPVMLLPRPMGGFLDRRSEAEAATAVLEGLSPVEFHGAAGAGKTALLRHLAHHKFAPVFPDGIVCFSAIRHRPLEDILMDLFDAFHEREPDYLPTPVQVRHALQNAHALIVLDDVDLERDEVEALMDATPGCVFLLASTERRLWGEGSAVALRGLPTEEALGLVERELGRTLNAEDRAMAEDLCAALEGNPLSLLQLSALVRDGHSLQEISERVQRHAGSAAEALAEQVLAERPERERRVLGALAVPVGPSLAARHVNALTGLADAQPELESLQRRGLVQEGDGGYILSGYLKEPLEHLEDPTSWANRAMEHFASWAERHLQDLEILAQDADSILGILEWGAQAEKWAEVLQLGRVVEGALAIEGQWGAWERVLGWELQAAQAVGDSATEGWALHQLGTRALCLEDTSIARENLSEALRLRESLGDWEGAAVTRHNLNLLGSPTPPDPMPDGNGSAWLKPSLWLGGLVLVSALALLIATLVARGGPGPTPSSEPTPSSLTLDRSAVDAGETVRGTVTLNGPAPLGGVEVSLSSSKPKVATVDPRVTIEEGNRSGTFTVLTSSLSASSISTLPISDHGKYLLVAQPACPDSDGDGICDSDEPECPDSDGDGICDSDEPECPDLNENGICDSAEPPSEPQPSPSPEPQPSPPDGREGRTTPSERENGQRSIEVRITASLKGVERSKTLIVQGAQ